MIESTFVFLKGIGLATERRFWSEGVLTWADFIATDRIHGLSDARKQLCDEEVRLAQQHHSQDNARFFAGCLKARDHWRLYEWLRPRTVFLDIETTANFDVSVVGLYANGQMTSLVRGESLTATRLSDELSRYDLMVTFNGLRFDLPCLRTHFPNLPFDQPHMDLCFVGRRLGLSGGLKRVEMEVGISRLPEVQGLDGWDAVRLWNRWRQSRSVEARDLLLAYNEADCRNLEPLADLCYSRMVKQHQSFDR